jgi:hypothetical protein
MELSSFGPEHIFDEMADEIDMYEKEPQNTWPFGVLVTNPSSMTFLSRGMESHLTSSGKGMNPLSTLKRRL